MLRFVKVHSVPTNTRRNNKITQYRLSEGQLQAYNVRRRPNTGKAVLSCVCDILKNSLFPSTLPPHTYNH